jgi:hypothetical protein
LPEGGAHLAFGVPISERFWIIADGSVGGQWIFIDSGEVNGRFKASIGLGVGFRF